jgi:hypothetical protein
MTEEDRRRERFRKADNEFLARLGAYLAVTGNNCAGLAGIVGMSSSTLYERLKAPGTFRLDEYRRICEEMDRALG